MIGISSALNCLDNDNFIAYDAMLRKQSFDKAYNSKTFTYTSGRNTFKFGLETTVSIQESSKVNLVQSLSTQ